MVERKRLRTVYEVPNPIKGKGEPPAYYYTQKRWAEDAADALEKRTGKKIKIKKLS